MLKRWQHVAGLAIAIGGMGFAAAFGGDIALYASYSLAVGLGIVIYFQADRVTIEGNATGNILVGYLAGVILSLAVATGLLVWFLNVPVDAGAWQMGLMLWDSWAGIGAAVLTGFFLSGFTALLY
jgi:hypothetical protein